jgi:dipeptide/tripeptide permease
MSNAEADVQYSAWSGVCYITPLIGGYLADKYLGRYKAILVSLHHSLSLSLPLHLLTLSLSLILPLLLCLSISLSL